MNTIWYCEDLRQYDEYVSALGDQIWAYFFMRGVEAYHKGYRKTPHYHGNAKAQSCWEAGHKYAEACQIKHTGLVTSTFFTSFMKGEKVSNTVSARYAVEARECWELNNYHSQERKTEMPGKPSKEYDLYQVKSTDRHGRLLARNSSGQFVLEMLDGKNTVEAFDPDTLEKVMPFTVKLRTEAGGSDHYEVPKGSYMKGDVYLCRSSSGPFMMEVMEVDTQCEYARSPSHFQILTRLYGVERPEPVDLQSPGEPTVDGKPYKVPAET